MNINILFIYILINLKSFLVIEINKYKLYIEFDIINFFLKNLIYIIY